MAEQLIAFHHIDEKLLTTMNITKARRDIGTSLISNSGMQTIYSVAIDHVTMNLQKGSYTSLYKGSYTSLYTHIFNFKDMYITHLMVDIQQL